MFLLKQQHLVGDSWFAAQHDIEINIAIEARFTSSMASMQDDGYGVRLL